MPFQWGQASELIGVGQVLKRRGKHWLEGSLRAMTLTKTRTGFDEFWNKWAFS